MSKYFTIKMQYLKINNAVLIMQLLFIIYHTYFNFRKTIHDKIGSMLLTHDD
jgi:hypothetical protein